MTYLLSHPRTFQAFAIASLIIIASLLFVPLTYAQSSGVTPGNPNAALDTFGQAASGLGQGTLPEVAGKVINAFLGILGVVAVVIIIIGGFKWMTAAGDTEKVDEAKNMLLAGVVGVIIILAAYAIARFVVGAVYEATR